MKKLTLLLLLVLICGISFAEFRGTEWGMSQKEVMSIEKVELAGDNEFLAGEGTILGYDCIIGYLFAEDKLCRSIYFIDKYLPDRKLIQAFHNLKQSLTEKYGAPQIDLRQILEQDLTSDYSEEDLLTLGYIEYLVEWETEKTIIQLTASAEMGNVGLLEVAAVYIGKDYQKLWDDYQKKKSLEDL